MIQFDLFTTFDPKLLGTIHESSRMVIVNAKPTQTEILYKYLKAGGRIADYESFNILGIPNLRSRICNIERQYGIKVQRRKREGKRYNEYFL